jgi:uncharacterized cupredoxin-like copper-binding protein
MKLLRFAVAAASLFFISACGLGTQSGPPTVSVTLDEFHVQLSSDSIGASKVTFEISNIGHERHEFVILRTDITPEALPVTQTATVTEEGAAIAHVDEIDGVSPGEQKSLTVDLKPGTYLLICNYPGHVHSGMAAFFLVT